MQAVSVGEVVFQLTESEWGRIRGNLVKYASLQPVDLLSLHLPLRDTARYALATRARLEWIMDYLKEKLANEVGDSPQAHGAKEMLKDVLYTIEDQLNQPPPEVTLPDGELDDGGLPPNM